MASVTCPYCNVPAQLDPGLNTCLCGRSFVVQDDQPSLAQRVEPFRRAVKRAANRGPFQKAVVIITLIWASFIVLTAISFVLTMMSPTSPFGGSLRVNAAMMLGQWVVLTFIYGMVLGIMSLLRWALR